MDGAQLINARFGGAKFVRTFMKGAQVEGADFAKAEYDKHTVLPFSAEAARKKGMVEVYVSSILIIPDRRSQNIPKLAEFFEDHQPSLRACVQKVTAWEKSLVL